MDQILAILGIAFLGAIYFTPTLIAMNRNHNDSGAIAVLNLVFGWTILFWFASLIWSLTGNVSRETFIEKESKHGKRTRTSRS